MIYGTRAYKHKMGRSKTIRSDWIDNPIVIYARFILQCSTIHRQHNRTHVSSSVHISCKTINFHQILYACTYSHTHIDLSIFRWDSLHVQSTFICTYDGIKMANKISTGKCLWLLDLVSIEFSHDINFHQSHWYTIDNFECFTNFWHLIGTTFLIPITN